MATNNKIELAKLLADLRRTNRQQSGLHKKLTPISHADAYKVAHLVEKELGWDVGGWKIAATNTKCKRSAANELRLYTGVFTRNLL